MSKYWKERAAQREMESQLIADKYLARMDASLREAQQDILRQIEAFYVRYAKDNQLSLAEARKYLTSKEVKEFKGVTLKHFKDMAKSGDLDYENFLNAISYRVRISRLEALQMQIQMRMIELYGGKNGLVDYVYSGLTEVYQNTYYQNMFAFFQEGIHTNKIIALSDDAIKEALTYNWSGKEFSKRIWGHEKITMLNIRKELEKSFTSGQSIQKTAKAIKDVTDVSGSRAVVLVRTESNFFHGLAAQQSYVDAGIEKYEVLATLDFRTSDICRKQDGEIYLVSEYQPGKTANPFHVRCRSTTAAWFDEKEYEQFEQRESMEGVIPSTTYEEWYRRYII